MALCEHCLKKGLQEDVSIRNILFVEPLNFPREQRERLCQLAFERLNVRGFQLQNQSALSLWATGKLDGVVLHVGEEMTTVAPFLKSKLVQEGVVC